MNWDINFISVDDFEQHVRNTVLYYGEKLVSYDIRKFNSNLIDPIKLVFDRFVYNKNWKELINDEIFRQRDKSNTNEIGYFHQRIFRYIKNCHVPDNGKEGGWDVICDIPYGYNIGQDKISKIYVELKNKHNTMNSSSAGKTYIKMQNQLLKHDKCVCFLVEALAKTSQDVPWSTSIDGQKVFHPKIRRVSIDKFYEIITGDSEAFLKICIVLPKVIQNVLTKSYNDISIPCDTAYEELQKISNKFSGFDEDTSMIMAFYMLAFGSYNGFANLCTREWN